MKLYKRLNELIEEYEKEFMYGGIQQAIDELENLIEEIGDRKFKTMAEIGTADGGTLWLYSNLFGSIGCKFIVTDMDIRPITKRVMAMITERMGVKFEIFECKNHMFRLKEPVEFLHIDGDHSYNATKSNYHFNEGMVVPGGMIVVHDTMLMEGPIRFRKELESSGVKTKTFSGHKTLCDCFGPNRINPTRRLFGMTIIYKEDI